MPRGSKSETKALKDTEKNEETAKKKVTSKCKKAGLTFPIERINRYIRKNGGMKRVGGSAPVFLTAIIEYIVTEVMDGAGFQTIKSNRKTINVDDILFAIRSDSDLKKVFSDYSVFCGDKIPKITETVTYNPSWMKSKVSEP